MEVVQLLGLQGLWQHQVLGIWRLGQQQTQRSKRVWQPVLANTLQCSCLEKPLTEKPGSPQSTGSQSWTCMTKATLLA